MAMQKELGNNITTENIKDYLWRTLRSGQVVPGYDAPRVVSLFSLNFVYADTVMVSSVTQTLASLLSNNFVTSDPN